MLTGTNGSSVTDDRCVGGVWLQPGDRQHGDDQLHRDQRPVRADNITGNTGWPAAPDLRVRDLRHGRHHRHHRAVRAVEPGLHRARLGQIRLAWSASTDNVAVTGYDVYANGALRGSVGAGVLTYTDTQPGTATVAYYVRAKDAAGNRLGQQQHGDPYRHVER